MPVCVCVRVWHSWTLVPRHITTHRTTPSTPTHAQLLPIFFRQGICATLLPMLIFFLLLQKHWGFSGSFEEFQDCLLTIFSPGTLWTAQIETSLPFIMTYLAFYFDHAYRHVPFLTPIMRGPDKHSTPPVQRQRQKAVSCDEGFLGFGNTSDDLWEEAKPQVPNSFGDGTDIGSAVWPHYPPPGNTAQQTFWSCCG